MQNLYRIHGWELGRIAFQKFGEIQKQMKAKEMDERMSNITNMVFM
jgi:hypothetical protein